MMSRILAISGSPSPTSRTTRILHHIGAHLTDGDTREFDVVKVRDLPPRALLEADVTDPAIATAVTAVRAADGVILATPIYKAAYSGALKAFLDLLPQHALAGKVVLPLATGGTLAHMLALDYALRPVLTVMGAAHVVPGYFLLDRFVGEGPDGELLLEDGARAALDGVLSAFLRALPSRVSPDVAAV